MVLARILPFPSTSSDSNIFRSSHLLYHFPVLTWILQFLRTPTDSTLFRYSPRQFFSSHTDSTFTWYSPDSIIFRYSHGFYHFSVLARIVSFPGTRPDSTFFGYLPGFYQFRYSHWLYPFPVLTLTGFRYSPNSIIFRYSTRVYHFYVLSWILPYFGIRPDSFSVFARILPLPGTRPILLFFGTHTDSTIFRYSPGQFFGTRTNSKIFRHSPGFYHFSILTLILPFSGTRPAVFTVLARILLFPSTWLLLKKYYFIAFN